MVLVADRHHDQNGWLYQPGYHLTELAQSNRVTEVKVGGIGGGFASGHGGST